MRLAFFGAALIAGTGIAAAADLNIPLGKDASVERSTAEFRCDAAGVKLGLPAGPFIVEYINGGGNALAVLPIHEKPMIFASVFAADGARYAAGRFIWWDAPGRSITLSAETTEGHEQSDCKAAEKK
jgi:membrane-bound inhibitor of C-type lysozyme